MYYGIYLQTIAFFTACLCGRYTRVTYFPQLCLFVLVGPVEIIMDMRKTFEAEVTTTETRTRRKMVIDLNRQDETRLSEITPSRIAPLSKREKDDWFALFDVIRQKPVVVPPGTFLLQKVCICIAKSVFK